MSNERYFLRKIWKQMHRRCCSEKDQRFSRYGARGIRVCEEWSDFEVFEKWALENGYTHGLSIDRKDNDGPYAPWNCRWATPKEQANNTSRNRKVSFSGETHSVSEWSDITGIPASALTKRLRSGWSAEKALTYPIRQNLIEHNGETRSLAEWSRITGLSENTISRRIRRGWPVEKSLTKPSERCKT